MPNQTYALEWLNLAMKNLETAKLLFREDHYTDIIATEIHQTIEKVMKSIIAYNGDKIPKTHDLMNLYEPSHDKFFDTQFMIINTFNCVLKVTNKNDMASSI